MLWTCLAAGLTGRAQIVFETQSPYHHIQVVDERGTRTLSFDGSMETKMSLTNPLLGHFEYTEYFHLPWLWNAQMKRVLMIGLGGGSIQRAYQHDYPGVTVETAELDRAVIRVAREYFGVQETPTLRIFNQDGRQFLRRAKQQYDAIILDAYTTGRYGSVIPYPLATREFFALAKERLTTNGVLAYNVIATLHGRQSDILQALCRTMSTVFPQLYVCPARESQNVVVLATRQPQRLSRARLLQEAAQLVRQGRVKLPTFTTRVGAVLDTPSPFSSRAPILTDDHAPVDGLLGNAGR
jgi:spermidine synthase